MRLTLLSFFLILFSFSIGQNNYQSDFEVAKTFGQEGKYLKAIAVYDQIIESYGMDYAAHYNRGLCYFSLQKNKEALQDFEIAYAVYADNARLNALIGNCYFELEEPQLAIQFLTKAKMLSNEDLGTDFFIGSIYYFEEQYDSAIVFLHKALEINPNNDEALNNLAWSYLDSDPAQSCHYFNLAFEKDSLNYLNTNNLAYAHLLCGNLEETKKYLFKSQKLNAKNSFLYRNFALYYQALGEKKKSCKNLQKAIELNIIEEWGEKYVQELIDYCN